MLALLVFIASLLVVALCGGGGVVLQQFYNVVERPLEFVPAPVDVEPVQRIEPIDPAPPPPSTRPRPRPRRPRPVVPTEPTPAPAEPEPASSEGEVPESPEPGPVTPVSAQITVSGDGEEVSVSGGGSTWALPASVPPGTYEVHVRFGEGDRFMATTFLVLDTTPREVICRASRGICKVVP